MIHLKKIIKSLWVVFFFVVVWSTFSYAAPCSVCGEDPAKGELTLWCNKGHLIDSTCLNNQITSLEDIQKLKEEGLPCLGDQCRCDQTFSLDEICSALQPEQIEALAQRLDAAFQPADSALIDQEVQHLSRCMIDAFNLHCPNEGCGGILDKIEGCNAATCSNKECKARFCYLCLKPQEDGPANHAHARQHSKDFWEKRPGYTERYHWLLARKRLAFVFQQRVDPAVREALLNAQHRMLKERKMWPFPAGIMSAKWIQEVQSDRQLNPEERMALLQNEFIYQRQRGNSSNATQVEAEIRRLGGKVLASLDVGDAGGINPQSFTSAAAGVGDRVQPHPAVQPHAQEMVPGLEHVLENDPRVTRNFAVLGEMYKIAGFIWSGMAPEGMNHAAAIQYCQGLGGGARLPTKEEWEVLKRVMSPGGRYNPDLLPDMKYKFWSSSSYDANKAYSFNGKSGSVSRNKRSKHKWVSCVVSADAAPVVPLNPVIRPAPAPVVQPNQVRQNLNEIVPVMEQSIPKPAPKMARVVVQPPGEVRVDLNAIIPVMDDGPGVSDAFSRLGNMYQVGGLIWSGMAPNQMNHPDATQYCQDLGGGARLPTKNEWEALRQAMSTGGMYNPNLLPDMKGKKGFWSSSVPSNNAARAFYFNGTSGSLASFRSRTSYYSVRCVRDFDVVQPPGEVQVDPNTIIPVMDDDPRISDAFRRLGNMYQVGGLIWSGMAPNQMNHPDATQYCQDLGGGARLPTKNEWEALRQAMSTGGMYNPNLIPDMQHLFWSSSINLFNSDFAFCFDGNGVHACSYDDGRLYNYSVRCVIKGTTTQQQQTITSSSNSVSRSTKKLIANFHSIVQVAPSDPRVSHDFAALGAVHETAGLIWSAVTPENMNQAAAIQYCQGLGGGARLPTKEEWEVLKQVMTIPSGKYSPKLLPGTKGKWFWSSSVHPTYAVSAFYFDGSNGGVGRDNRYSFYSVRCVIGGVTTQQQQAVASSSNSVSSSSQSVPTQSSHAIGLIASNDLRVTRSFAALGNMYQVGELIWSGVAPKEMNQREAERFCQALGQGARLPTKEEWEVLKQVMTIPSRNFNPELLPGTKGKWFWSSSVGPNDAENAFHFYGTFGYVGSFSRHINASVRA